MHRLRMVNGDDACIMCAPARKGCDPSHLARLEQLHVEDQGRAGRDDRRGSRGAVSQVGRNHQLAAPAHLHAATPSIPPGDHLAAAQREGERLLPGPGCCRTSSRRSAIRCSGPTAIWPGVASAPCRRRRPGTGGRTAVLVMAAVSTSSSALKPPPGGVAVEPPQAESTSAKRATVERRMENLDEMVESARDVADQRQSRPGEVGSVPIGTAGFEPATPATPLQCATGLRYVPSCGTEL